MRLLGIFCFILFASFLLLSCASEEEKPPEEVIPEERFQELLLELYLLEGEAKFRQANQGLSSDSVRISGTTKLFEKHDIERDRFERSYRYHMEDPEKMKRIHEEILNELMRRSGKEKEDED